jgi:hypothetical protein
MSVKQSASVLGYVGMSQSVDRNEWYTPIPYIDAVRHVLGEIDFDPYSDAIAQKTVQARRFRTKEDDQGSWPDVKTVFMNPPYSRGLVKKAVYEFIIELRKQKFSAIVLTNNATETQWFQLLLLHADALCLTNHRIAFYSADGKAVSGNTRGQAFFYFGNQVRTFQMTFNSPKMGLPDFGFICKLEK